MRSRVVDEASGLGVDSPPVVKRFFWVRVMRPELVVEKGRRESVYEAWR